MAVPADPVELIVSIDAPHFNAGVVVVDDRVVDAAPILRYMLGWDSARVRTYCAKKGWTATRRRG